MIALILSIILWVCVPAALGLAFSFSRYSPLQAAARTFFLSFLLTAGTTAYLFVHVRFSAMEIGQLSCFPLLASIAVYVKKRHGDEKREWGPLWATIGVATVALAGFVWLLAAFMQVSETPTCLHVQSTFEAPRLKAAVEATRQILERRGFKVVGQSDRYLRWENMESSVGLDLDSATEAGIRICARDEHTTAWLGTVESTLPTYTTLAMSSRASMQRNPRVYDCKDRCFVALPELPDVSSLVQELEGMKRR